MNAPTAPPRAAPRPAESAPPSPLAPLGGTVVDGAAATFTWRGVPDATRYRLQLSPDRQFARDVLDLDAGPSTQLALLDALPLGAPLFWRVCAETPQGPTRWSPYGRFVPGTDDAADAFRAQEEAAHAEAHRARLRREAEEAAARDLVPFFERDDAVPSDREAGSVGLAMILSVVLVLLAALAATTLGG